MCMYLCEDSFNRALYKENKSNYIRTYLLDCIIIFVVLCDIDFDNFITIIINNIHTTIYDKRHVSVALKTLLLWHTTFF